MTKTMGQINYETGQKATLDLMPALQGDWIPWEDLGDLQQVHEICADAVLEAIAADAEHCADLRQNSELMQLHVTDRLVAQQQGYALREFAARIRALKSTKEV